MFGFSPSKYQIHEDDGSVMIEVIFFQGIPGDYQPVVLISTHNGTATGQQVFFTKLMQFCDRIILLQKVKILVPYHLPRSLLLLETVSIV